MLNLDFETAKFIKNEDDTYTVYQRIGTNSTMVFHRVKIVAEGLPKVGELSDEVSWSIIKNQSVPDNPTEKSNLFKEFLYKLKFWR